MIRLFIPFSRFNRRSENSSIKICLYARKYLENEWNSFLADFFLLGRRLATHLIPFLIPIFSCPPFGYSFSVLSLPRTAADILNHPIPNHRDQQIHLLLQWCSCNTCNTITNNETSNIIIWIISISFHWERCKRIAVFLLMTCIIVYLMILTRNNTIPSSSITSIIRF